MLASVQLLFTVAYNGVYYHLVAFLIDVGYSPQKAALIFGAKSIFVIFGTIYLGGLGDRIGARRVLAFAMVALCLSLIALLGASSPLLGGVALALFTVFYGTPTGSTSTLVPMLLAESLGMRRFPTLMGIIGLVATVAAALGPLVTGRMFRRDWQLFNTVRDMRGHVRPGRVHHHVGLCRTRPRRHSGCVRQRRNANNGRQYRLSVRLRHFEDAKFIALPEENNPSHVLNWRRIIDRIFRAL